jgi:DNA polymerase-3 subunit gamma/tau
LYQALYRKWRPKTFDEVYGQQHITDILKKQILLGKLSHAYLFTGTRGTGKTTCAKLLARAVNCENPVGGNPCGLCPSCTGIENGSILDVTEMDAASNNGVENVRALREEAVYTPSAVKRRVYIIDEVHMLSNSAFNALLKILEEPPEHLIFILATTELHKVPSTILSRCQRYSFRRIPPEVISKRLSEIALAENMKLTEEAALLLARLGDGSFRDAISLLDQCSGEIVDRERVLSAIGIAENEVICGILTALLKGDGAYALDKLNDLYLGGKDVAEVLNQLASLHRDMLLMKIAPKGGSGLLSGSFTDASLKELCGLADKERLLYNLNELQETLSKLVRSGDRRLASELCLLKLCGLKSAASETVPEPKEAPRRQEVKLPETSAAADIKTDTISERAPEPEALPEQKTEAPALNEAYSAYTWNEVVNSLKDKLIGMEAKIISQPEETRGEVSKGLVKIIARTDYSYGLLNSPIILEQVRAAASALAGEQVTVKTELKKE